MLGNSIPIYRGAPNVSKYFNTNSFINYEDYEKNYDKIVDKIIQLDKNDKKYNKILSRQWLTTLNKNNIARKIKRLEIFIEKIIK